LNNVSELVKEKVEELNNVCDEYKKMKSTLKLNRKQVNPFLHHLEIFFSPKEIKNINFKKLISIGNFGKVVKIFDFKWIPKFLKKFLKSV